MNLSEAPYQFECGDTYSVLSLYPLINDGQWGNVSQVGTEILTRLENLKSPALIVDLSPLDYMGSAQVALLVRVWKSLKKIHGRMVVQCPGQMVREVLAIAGLKALWDIVETRDAALMSLGLNSSTPTSRPSVGLGPVVAIVALVVAGIALGLTTNIMLGVASRNIILADLGLLAVAVLAGGFTALMQRGLWRGVGTSVVVASVVMLAIALVQLNGSKLTQTPEPSAPSGESGATASTSGTAVPPTRETDGDKDATPEAQGKKKSGRNSLLKGEEN